MVPPCSDRITRVPPYSSLVIDFAFRVRGYHPLWPDFPDRSTKLHRLVPTGLFRVRSPLLTESRLISFPSGTEMFQFPEFASLRLCIQRRMSLAGRVSPLRYLRINVCCRLPEAFRRLPRLSSPSTAKASTLCAYLLDHITPNSLNLSSPINSR